ncbi:hypothetical protein HYH03_011154 [Edaphochlamys debaryana]|uniref:TOG domain-containing protein n=1 Tax=Edaphochlamys debaryana TaxID=47281 RepID=A0A835XSF3_9CHLO|nr:hypothetical protein HYH03_011154 [Edaphochlamys debaryana]|eukprot:KAG2490352.1 hypothetical protein HYH03_011154 [Edaphochlamys debaryana]
MSTSDDAWKDIVQDLRASNKQRVVSGLDSLEALLKRTSLNKVELSELVDLSPSLLVDANSKVALQALETLEAVIKCSDTPLSPHDANLLVPCVAERLGDSRQPVRAQALNVLVSLFQTLRPELVLDKLSPCWQHKNWKVKQGLLEVLAEVVSKSGAAVLGGKDQNNAVIKQVVRMMEDPDVVVRDAAAGCLAEVYRQAPAAALTAVQASSLRPEQQRQALARMGVSDAPAPTPAPDTTTTKSRTSGSASSSSGGGAGPYYAPASGMDATGRLSGSGTAGPAHDTAPPARAAADARRASGAAAGAAPSTAAAPAKRGGFKDSGGVTVDGELPTVTPIPITSERELRSELEAATAELAQAPSADWLARMAAMQKVEGLVLGGALEYEAFHDCLKGLTQALSQQFKERRSSIARQCCHLIGVLAQALGPRFESHAIALLPTLFGVLVITVAVMAESADVGVRAILRHCQTSRLLQAISDGICKEKNPKARQWGATYLVQILEDWHVSVWSRNLEAVEGGIKAAAQDAAGETRQAGRTAMALYNSALPDRAAAFLRRLDPGLQDRLASAVGAAAPAKASKPASAASGRASIAAAIAAKKALAKKTADDESAGIFIAVPGQRPSPRREQPSAPAAEPSSTATLFAPRRPAGRTSISGASAAPAYVADSPAEPSSASGPAPSLGAGSRLAGSSGGGAAGRSSRKSLGMPPGRIPGGSADLTALLGEPSSSSSLQVDPAVQARAAALRRPRMSALPYDLPQRVPVDQSSIAAGRVPMPSQPPSQQQPQEQHSGRPPMAPGTSTSSGRHSHPGYSNERISSGGAAASSTGGGGGGSTEPGTASGPLPPGMLPLTGLVPLSRVVAVILGGPRTWNEKVDALTALAANVRASAPGGGAEFACLGHGAVAPAEPERVGQALERVRERLLEALDDPHQKVLSAALSLLSDVLRCGQGRALEPQLDRLLPALLGKGAEGKEGVRGQCAEVLSECGQAFRPDALLPALSKSLDIVKLPRGKQAALEFFVAQCPRWGALSTNHLRHWLVRLAPLLEDRLPDLRRRAAEALEVLLGCGGAPAREAVNYVAYQHNSADAAPLRRFLLQSPATAALVSGPLHATTSSTATTLTSSLGPHPGATVTSGSLPPAVPSSTANLTGTVNLTAQAAAAQVASLSLSGAPPASTSDSRRQLPSAIYPAPLPTAGPGPGPASATGPASGGPSGPMGSGPAAGAVGPWGPGPQGQGLPPPQQAWPAPASTSAADPYGAVSAYPASASGSGPCAAPFSHSGGTPPPAPSGSYYAQASGQGLSQGPGPGPYSGTGTASGKSGFGLPGSGRSPLTPNGQRRPALPVPTEPNAQLLFLGQLLDAARAAVGAAVGATVNGALDVRHQEAVTTVMEHLAEAAERCGRDVWLRTFPLLMVDAHSWSQHPARSVRAVSFALLRELQAAQPQLFTDANLEAQTGLMLGGVGDAAKEVSLSASAALRSLLAACSPRPGLALLAAALPREREAHRRSGDKGARLGAVMDGVRQLAARLDSRELNRLTFQPHPEIGASLLEALVSNLSDTETSVRRGAVITLADLWYRLGHGVRDVLQVLASSSYNLLCIYYLKLHGVTVVAAEQNPADHPLVVGSVLRGPAPV